MAYGRGEGEKQAKGKGSSRENKLSFHTREVCLAEESTGPGGIVHCPSLVRLYDPLVRPSS